MANKTTKTPVMVLHELSVKKGQAPPIYDLVLSQIGTHQNRFDYEVRVMGLCAVGTGTSKQISKHNAAHNMLMKLKDRNIYNPEEDPVQEFKSISAEAGFDGCLKAGVNFIGPLRDLCLQQKIEDPEFTLISEVGPPHSKEFTYECKLSSIITRATGNTKRMAKQLAAKDMFEKLKGMLPAIVEEFQRNNEEQLKAISSTSEKVVDKFNQLICATVPNKTLKVDEYSGTLKRLIEEHDKTIVDFEQDLQEKSPESFKRILRTLDLDYILYKLKDDDPVIVSLTLTTDTPFTMVGCGSSEEEAFNDAVYNSFLLMDLFMRK